MAKPRQAIRPSRPTPAAPSQPRRRWRDGAICAGLLLLIAVAYWPVARNQFINYDDDGYVVENEYVSQGLSLHGIVWAFTSMGEARGQANWHPLTWISHMIDCQLFKLEPAGHHLMSLAFHALNTVLLYCILLRMTAAPWPSAAVAALFALHPLHVESVAWVAERKDVLSTFFGLVALWAWLGYVARPGFGRYLSVMLWYAASLMSKPMLVTLPLLLLLLDWWPLRRMRAGPHPLPLSHPVARDGRERGVMTWLVLEKIPVALLAAGSCAMTLFAQSRGHAVVSLTRLPIYARPANVALAYCGYLKKLFVPIDLAPIYPLPKTPDYLAASACGAALVAVTVALVWAGRRRAYLAVGWLWYLLLLTPVIGIVQVGMQSMADRYTYLPAVGIFILLAWSAADAIARWPWLKRPVAGLAAMALATCCALSNAQVCLWGSTKTLFTHTAAVTADNVAALTNLGLVAINENRYDDAARDLHEALRLDPAEIDALGNLATLYRRQKNYDAAMRAYAAVDHFCPNNPKCYDQEAQTMKEKGDLAAEEVFLGKALAAEPTSIAFRGRLALTLQSEHKNREAIENYLDLLRDCPSEAGARNNAAWIYATDAQLQNGARAIELLEPAIKSTQRDANLLDTLAAAYAAAGRFDEAVATAEEAIAKGRAEKAPASAVADMEKRLELYKNRQPYRE